MAVASRNSQMRVYHGYAAADKAQDSHELYVYSEELLPFVQGEISAVEMDNDISTKGSTSSYSGSIKTTNVIKATYRDDTTNRAFPPDVRKGEQVVLFNYGDTDVWYWKSEGRNDTNRRLETFRQSISGSRENAAEQTDDNTYFVELDSLRKKAITISTSGVDGEKHRYMIKIDCDASSIFIGDEAGNQIYIDSETPRVCMKNKSNSLLDLNIENIVMACQKDISIKAEGGNIALQAGKSIQLQAAEDVSTSSGKNTTLSSGANMTQQIAQGWGVSYGTTGSCSGSGAMTMQVAHLSIK